MGVVLSLFIATEVVLLLNKVGNKVFFRNNFCVLYLKRRYHG
jgi:hypothetical protein